MVAVTKTEIVFCQTHYFEFSINNKITIEQKYLTKGHTQMECDSGIYVWQCWD